MLIVTPYQSIHTRCDDDVDFFKSHSRRIPKSSTTQSIQQHKPNKTQQKNKKKKKTCDERERRTSKRSLLTVRELE